MNLCRSSAQKQTDKILRRKPALIHKKVRFLMNASFTVGETDATT